MEEARRGAVCPGTFPVSARDWGQVLMFEGESCLPFRSFTSWLLKSEAGALTAQKGNEMTHCHDLLHRSESLPKHPTEGLLTHQCKAPSSLKQLP
jgi:hypothetical protein